MISKVQARGLLKIFSVVGKKSNIKLLITLPLISFAEVLSIFSLMPFVSRAMDLGSQNFLISAATQVASLFGSDSELLNLGFLSIVLAILAFCSRVFATYTISSYVERVRLETSRLMLDHYLNLSYLEYLRVDGSDISKIILTEIDQLIQYVVKPIVGLVQSLIIVSMLTFGIVYVSGLGGIYALLAGGLVYAIIIRLTKSRLRSSGNSMVEENKRRHKSVMRLIDGFKEVKFLKLHKNLNRDFLDSTNQYCQAHRLFGVVGQIPNYLVEMLLILGVVGVFMYFYIAHDGSVDTELISYIPELSVFLFSIIRLKPALNTVYQGFSAINYSSKSIENLSCFNGQKKDAERTGQKHKFANLIELKDVSYGYGRGVVLSNINAIFKKNSLVLIRGPSGSGKTTLIDLLTGLLSPKSGKILIDGVDLESISESDWLGQISYVPQRSRLLSDSIVDIVTMGSEEYNPKKVECVLRKLKLDDLLDESGMEGCNLGEFGDKLSGGQGQRLAIARAMYQDRAIFILDEPTSNLDAQNRKNILNLLREESKNKLVIMISHHHEDQDYADLVLDLTTS